MLIFSIIGSAALKNRGSAHNFFLRYVTKDEIFYTKANRLLRLFYCCSTDVKLTLFRSYCGWFYCPFLWTHYKKSTHSKLRVVFNNVYRRILKLPPRRIAMYAVITLIVLKFTCS